MRKKTKKIIEKGKVEREKNKKRGQRRKNREEIVEKTELK